MAGIFEARGGYPACLPERARRPRSQPTGLDPIDSSPGGSKQWILTYFSTNPRFADARTTVGRQLSVRIASDVRNNHELAYTQQMTHNLTFDRLPSTLLVRADLDLQHDFFSCPPHEKKKKTRKKKSRPSTPRQGFLFRVDAPPPSECQETHPKNYTRRQIHNRDTGIRYRSCPRTSRETPRASNRLRSPTS